MYNYVKYPLISHIKCFYFSDPTSLETREEILTYSSGFLVQMMTSKSPFEINWSLVFQKNPTLHVYQFCNFCTHFKFISTSTDIREMRVCSCSSFRRVWLSCQLLLLQNVAPFYQHTAFLWVFVPSQTLGRQTWVQWTIFFVFVFAFFCQSS